MCGIAGLYTKSPALHDQLGELLSRMLAQLSDRGPDSAGVAFYRDRPRRARARSRFTHRPPIHAGTAVGAELGNTFGLTASPSVRASHATFVIATTLTTRRPGCPSTIQN